MIHECLQDQHGSHTVNGGSTFFDTQFSFAEDAIRLHRGETFIPEVKGKRKVIAKDFRESQDLFRLGALVAAQTKGKSNHDFRDVVSADDAGDLLQVAALISSFERFDALRGETKRVRNRQPYATQSHIHAQQPAPGLPAGVGWQVIFIRHSAIIGALILLSGHMAANPTEEHVEEQAPAATPVAEDRPATLPEAVRRDSIATTIIASFLVLAGLYYAQLVCVVICVSLLFAFVLEPVVHLQERIRIPRSVGALVAVLLVVAGVYALGNLSYNKLIDFSQELPKYSTEIRKIALKYEKQAQTIRKSTEGVLPASNEKNTIKVTQQSNLVDKLSSNLGTATELIFAATFVPFLAYFMLTWKEHARSSSVLLFSRENRSTAYATLGAITEMIRGFIVGNFLVGVFIGLLSTAVFAYLGLPYFYFIGFISGFLSLVPYLGVLLAIVPPLLSGVGVVHGSGFIVIVLTVFGLHLFAMNVLYPKFLGKRLQLNPLAVTVALLFWGWIWGAMGLILAIPMTAAAKIVFDHIPNLRPYGAWLGE
jgi:predicted PurR-regulated permease PerM